LRLLLDTHIVLWTATNLDRLSARENMLIINSRNVVAVSAVSIWEIRIKWDSFFRSGTRKLTISPVDILGIIEATGWPIVPLTGAHAAATLDRTPGHKDPFDELLLVQAQVEGMRLLTRDEKLADHPLALIA
jgi:PIN domain nuclease of toxin-antitoxin system